MFNGCIISHFRRKLGLLYITPLLCIVYCVRGIFPETYEQLPLSEYKHYGSMSMFHYSVPQQVSRVHWQFVATVDDAHCPRRTTYIALQHGSFPVLSPNNASFPDKFVASTSSLFKIRTTTEYRPNSTTVVQVLNPLPGNWFAAAYLLPLNKGISVKGLGRSCNYALSTVATWSPQRSAMIILPEQSYHSHISSGAREPEYRLYKVFVPESVWSLHVSLSNCTSNMTTQTCAALRFSVRARALPYFSSHQGVDCNMTGDEGGGGGAGLCEYSVPQPYTQTYYYILVHKDYSMHTASYNLMVHMKVCDAGSKSDAPPEVAAFSSPQYLGLDHLSVLTYGSLHPPPMYADTNLHLDQLYNLNTTGVGGGQLDHNDSVEVPLDHHPTQAEVQEGTNRSPETQVVQVQPGADGELGAGVVEVQQLVQNLSVAPVTIHDNMPVAVSAAAAVVSRGVSVRGRSQCLVAVPMQRIKHMEDFSDTFVVEGKHWYTSDIEVSDGPPPALYTFHLLPYVDIGGTLQFAATLLTATNFSNDIVSVDICIEEGKAPMYNNSVVECRENRSLFLSTNYTNASGGALTTDAMYFPFPNPGAWFFTTQAKCMNRYGAVERCSNTVYVSLDVKTTPCMRDSDGNMCGQHGYCKEAIQGQFLYAYCRCTGGWRGWACNDGSQATSALIQMLGTLLLTLSNLMFLPAIVLAIYRRYLPEAMVYAATMFFSAFYHACDQDEYAWCLMKYNVLQFSDFYLSILSFWMTLIAMSRCSSRLVPILHVGGCIGIALGVFTQRFGILSFAVPACIAAIIMILSWNYQCYKQRQCYPTKRQYLLHLLPGILLAAIGLILYAFVETQDNYRYTHSVWHILMSLSIVFLLPDRGDRWRDCSKSSDQGSGPSDDGASPAEDRLALCVNDGADASSSIMSSA